MFRIWAIVKVPLTSIDPVTVRSEVDPLFKVTLFSATEPMLAV